MAEEERKYFDPESYEGAPQWVQDLQEKLLEVAGPFAGLAGSLAEGAVDLTLQAKGYNEASREAAKKKLASQGMFGKRARQETLDETRTSLDTTEAAGIVPVGGYRLISRKIEQTTGATVEQTYLQTFDASDPQEPTWRTVMLLDPSGDMQIRGTLTQSVRFQDPGDEPQK